MTICLPLGNQICTCISGADPGILVRGGVDFFFSKACGLRPPQGPQWVKGNALVGAQGANSKPPEAPEFQ